MTTPHESVVIALDNLGPDVASTNALAAAAIEALRVEAQHRARQALWDQFGLALHTPKLAAIVSAVLGEPEGEKECEHQWKFNGGDPLCLRCGAHQDPNAPPRVFPATLEDGTK